MADPDERAGEPGISCVFGRAAYFVDRVRQGTHRFCARVRDPRGRVRRGADGGHINAAFLAAGLLDEVSILVGAGIDGRGGMGAVFDGLPMERGVTPLKLAGVKAFESDAVWLRYDVKHL